MARICDRCGKGKMRGNTVSHSNRKAPRHYKPNLQKETFEVNGNTVSLKVCTKCKKTLAKVPFVDAGFVVKPKGAPTSPVTPTTPVAEEVVAG